MLSGQREPEVGMKSPSLESRYERVRDKKLIGEGSYGCLGWEPWLILGFIILLETYCTYWPLAL